jgi:hypothetical protein
MLNEEAKAMLLQLIKVNGGSIHRGALNATLQELYDEGEIELRFTPDNPKNHTEYSYVLPKKGAGK